MDIDNLNSLKVADLKQLLKARGLSMVGIKSELIERLQASLLSQPIISTGGVVAGSAKVSVKEIDEDAILGDEDDGSLGKPDDSILHNEDLLLSESNIDTGNIVAKTVPIVPKAAVIQSLPSPPANAPMTPERKNVPGSPASSVGSLKQAASSKNILTVEQKKELRLLKFGDPKIKNRVERFGITNEKPPSENEQLKKRVHRFGEAVSEKAKTLDEQERIEKRRERFGAVNSSNNKSSNGFKPVAAAAPLIQKRQERFGVVEKAAIKSDQGFKRRRFAY